MRRRFHGGLLATVVALFLLATPALAGGPNAVIADCTVHGQLTGTYSAAELKNALATMPATVKEYTSCYDTIQAALLKQVGQQQGSSGSSGQPGSGGGFLSTPVIVVLVVLALIAAAFAALAIRRRSAAPPGGPGGETGV